MEKTCQQSNSSVTPKRPRVLIFILCILFAISMILLVVSIRGILRSHEIRRRIEPLIKQSLELNEQIDTQQAAVLEEGRAIAEELKKPQEQRAANLGQRLKVNTERTEAIRALIKQQQKTIEILQKTEEELGIVPKKESSEAKAVMEKY
jgi:hypothetical protein